MKKGNAIQAMSVDERSYKVESAARTLREAEEIKKDPKLLSAAQAKMREEAKSITTALAAIKQRAGKK